MRRGLWLEAQLPDIGDLMLTNFDSELCALRLLDGNTTGVGYLIKDRVPDIREIALVKEGRNVLDAKIKAALLPLPVRNRLGEDLTAIETETLRLVVEGRTNKLGLASATGASGRPRPSTGRRRRKVQATSRRDR